MARPSVAKTPFSQRLTAVREALGYKERKAFAEKLNMHPDTLGGYERGDTFPDQQFLTRYKREFSVNLDWLITGDGRMFNSVADIISERIAADLAGPPVEKVSALETLRVLAPRHAETGPDQVRLAAAIEAVEEGLAGRNVAPSVKAELTIAAYHLLAAATDENRAQVIRLVKGA
ncbi:helix-turn-helix domain-containing protein [Tabrizicola sp. SY72]|nr:helix-turn-helix domain-containing protein [Tabrizicola sp. SY72]